MGQQREGLGSAGLTLVSTNDPPVQGPEGLQGLIKGNWRLLDTSTDTGRGVIDGG